MDACLCVYVCMCVWHRPALSVITHTPLHRAFSYIDTQYGPQELMPVHNARCKAYTHVLKTLDRLHIAYDRAPYRVRTHAAYGETQP